MKTFYIAPLNIESNSANIIQALKTIKYLFKTERNITVVLKTHSKEYKKRLSQFLDKEYINNVYAVYIPLKEKNRAIFFAINRILFIFASMILALRKKPDAIICRSSEPLALVASVLLPNSCVLFEVHEIPKKGLRRAALLRLLKSENVLLAPITRETKKELISIGGDPKRIRVIPDAVDLEDYQQVRPLKKKDGIVRVGYFGKIATSGEYKWKGVNTLIESMRFLPKKFHLFLFGKTIGRIRIPKELSERVHLMGNISHNHVPKKMVGMDVLVLPSSGKSEFSQKYSSPLKLFEYLASGKAIVASDLPPIREIVTEKEVTFFNPDDPEDLAKKIIQAYRNMSKERKGTCLKKAEKFSYNARARQLLKIINKMREDT